MLELLLHLDHWLFQLINTQWTAPWADVFFPLITDLHKTLAFKLTMLPLIVYLLIKKLQWKKGVLTFLFMVFSMSLADGIGNYAFKKTIQRPRPAHTENLEVQVRAKFGGYSFVSNHAANSFAVATFAGLVFPKLLFPLYGIAALIAYSRVYNGVHFPTDVTAGAILGIMVSLMTYQLYKFVLNKWKL